MDSTTKRLVTLNDAGAFAGRQSGNDATAAMGSGFAADTWVTNSGILIPSFGMKAGQLYRWLICATKTAAGTAAMVVTVRIGSAQSTSDTARLVLTTATAQTAAVAAGIMTIAIGVQSVSATGVIAGGFGWAAAVGLGGGAAAVSSTFDNTALGGQYVGISINGGTSCALTISHTTADLFG